MLSPTIRRMGGGVLLLGGSFFSTLGGAFLRFRFLGFGLGLGFGGGGWISGSFGAKSGWISFSKTSSFLSGSGSGGGGGGGLGRS